MSVTEVGKAYIQIVPSTGGMEGAIQNMLDPEAERAGNSAGGKFSNAFGGFLRGAATIAASSIAAATTGIVALTKSAYDAYASYEQLVGGVDTLFGESNTKVMENAAQAFRTAGLSANAYMETVTSFSASLIQSVGGDTEKAAEAADRAIISMSDNANKMGSSMESIQNAYQGFAKQNYTMLDNLKLGYGGTKTEMERLIKDASGMTEEMEKLGIAVDANDMSFGNIVNAISVVQEHLGIAGTTASEAASTLQGAAGSMSAAWENLIIGLGDESADLEPLIDNVINSVMTLLDNSLPRVEQILNGISEMITIFLPEIISIAVNIISENLPQFVDAAIQMINTIGQALIDNAPALMDAALLIVETIINLIVDNLPMILELGITLLTSLIEGITEALPDLIDNIVELIPTIVETLITNLPLILEAGTKLLLGLIDGLLKALPDLIKALPQIIDTTINTLLGMIPQIIECGVKLFTALVDNLPAIIEAITEVLPQIIDSVIDALIENIPLIVDAGFQLFTALVDNLPLIIAELLVAVNDIIIELIGGFAAKWDDIKEAGVQLFEQLFANIVEINTNIKNKVLEIIDVIKTAFTDTFEDMKNIGKNLIEGLWNGIEEMGSWIGDKIQGFGDGVMTDLKSFFGIESPSKLMRDEIGKYIPEGIAVGIEANADAVTSAMDELSNTTLDAARTSIRGNVSIDNNLGGNGIDRVFQLLAMYLPEIAEGNTVNLNIEADADNLFKVMQDKSKEFNITTGLNAFA